MLSYAHCIKADPVTHGLLYLGAENGMYVASDFKPTNQQLEVQKLHEELLSNCETQLKAIRERELTEFNQLLQKRNIPHVIITAAQPIS
jgi:hypothetical protein